MSVVFFNDYSNFQPAKCYLTPIGIDRLGPFLPLLTDVVGSAHFLLAVFALLNLLEVAPSVAHLALIVAAGKAWLTAYSDEKVFWIDQRVGPRLCSLINAILAQDRKPFALGQPLRTDIDILLGSLVRLGVAEAHRVEENLRSC